METFDLAEVVDRAVSRVRLPRAAQRSSTSPPLPWWVVGESGAVERAVTNLLDNAAKWSPADGTITVRLANGTLTVDDQGPGIEPDDLPHVFERFYRSTESRSMPGSGLGLAIVQQVVGRHSGHRHRGRRAGRRHADDHVAPGPRVRPLPGHARRSTSPSCPRAGFLRRLPPRRVGNGYHPRHSLEIQPTASSPTDGAVGLALPAGKDGRVRLLALALAAAVLTGCSGGSSSPAALARGPGRRPPRPRDDIGSHTPTDLQHPCDLVSARTASKALGEKVTAHRVTSELAARTLDCSYVPAEMDVDAPSLEIRSTPDPVTLDAMLRLYLGVDRLPHHPVDITGADDAEVVLEPEDDLVTVFVKQGFVTARGGPRRRGPRARRADRDQAGEAGAGGELSGELTAEGGQQPLGLPARLGVLLLDVGAHRDAAAGPQPVGAVARRGQRPDHHAEVGAAVGRRASRTRRRTRRAGCPRPPR